MEIKFIKFCMAMGGSFHTIIMFEECGHVGDALLACGADLDPKNPKKTIQWSLFPKKRVDLEKEIGIGLYIDDPRAQEILKKLNLPPTYVGNLPGVWPYFIFPVDAFEIGDEECDEGILIWMEPEEIAIFTLVFSLFFDFSEMLHMLFFEYCLFEDTGNIIMRPGLFFIKNLQALDHKPEIDFVEKIIENKTPTDFLFFNEVKTHSKEINIYLNEYNTSEYKLRCGIYKN